MDIRTYRAATMHEALELVRRELGPDAAVLNTREVTDRRFKFLPGERQIEVTASREVNVPSRFRQSVKKESAEQLKTVCQQAREDALHGKGGEWRETLQSENGISLSAMQGMQDLCRRAKVGEKSERPEEVFRAVADFLCAELGESVARGVGKMLVESQTVDSK